MRRDDVAAGPGDRQPSSPARLFLWPVLLLLCGGAVSHRVAALQHRAALGHARDAVRTELETIRGALARELFAAIHLTEGIAGLITVEGGMSEEKLRAFVTELFRRTDLVRNVAVAPGNVVKFVYPVKGNERAIGLDYARSAEQWPSVERMMKEGRMVVAGPVRLVQGGIGVIGRSPIYLSEPGGDPSARPRYWGLTSTVLELERLLARTPIASAQGLAIALRGIDGMGGQGLPFWGEAGIFDRDPVAVNVALPSGSWQLAAVPRDGWPSFRPATSISFVSGTSFSVLLAGLLLRLLQTGHAKDREVERRRAALAALTRAHDELEQRVAERTRELRLARDAAESADRLKSAFLATMSHELRTPLNSILGFTGILLQGLAGPLQPEQAKQLGMVRGSARHLLDLINDVLDISKIEAGQLEVRAAPFDLGTSIERVVGSVAPLAEKKGLTIRTAVPPSRPTIESDQRRVEQILLNLLNNAIKFTDRGGVTLTVELEGAADPAGGGGPPRVRLSVADTGIGIKGDDVPRLFQPFRQIDSGLQRRHEGTGLGLAICRRLTELLGGTISVESTFGRGSVFTVILPAGHASP